MNINLINVLTWLLELLCALLVVSSSTYQHQYQYQQPQQQQQKQQQQYHNTWLLELLCALLAVSLEKSIVANPVKLEYLPAKTMIIVLYFIFFLFFLFFFCLNQLTNYCQFPLTDEPPLQLLVCLSVFSFVFYLFLCLYLICLFKLTDQLLPIPSH